MEMPQLCPRFERAIELLSKRWSTLIVYRLLDGPQRFVDIENSLPNLSGKVLSDRLRELETEGVIQRTVYPEKPVRIEYSLTDKGRDLAPLMDDIQQWATRWVELD
ncbi:helix-turn-helix transcriptional regulator [Paenibacillus motobuensis]|uniref:CatDE operon transcriptional regulator CatR n=1 Tax=Paenibacillus motobuensis TaxID=295324 RepID=A0ABN0YQL1_9BACL|nr:MULTISPECIES: helix-turn-helix domain-containing protein [Paenibacillus]MCM3041609.1 helix-turn-helix transcriptional regulator [Paenibacillus lutimineralis]MCM3648713.1 helix-turn-helix transcriptional regulator [Paenibacillus motobuensis]